LSYWAVVVARNAAPHLNRTLNSLLNQASKPEAIVIVDDGSTDSTPDILRSYEHEYQRTVRVITRPDKGYDIRRVPSNINLACQTMNASSLAADFFMISGDDCFYPPNYAESLLTRMNTDPRIVIASGRPSSATLLSREHSPSGSGRMINERFWRDAGGEYPLVAGWESWLLYMASMKGLRACLFPDLLFEHFQPRGARHQFIYWGAAMQTLGYHPLYALGRIAKNSLDTTVGPKGSINMIRGYLQSKLGSDDPFVSRFDAGLRQYVRRQQAQRITHVISSVL
jgi:glycosyltransferase involved in cell wall biosynthesis